MKAQSARRLRQVHQYVGLFFTPAILFFALSGALQTLGWHENHGGGPPPATWICWMASIHKDQRLLRPDEGAGHQEDHGGRPVRHNQERGGTQPSPVPLKVFVVLLTIGLAASSILGTIIALTNRASWRPTLAALLLGTILPVLLAFV